MSEKPIIFSDPMVRAILEDLKGVTRRVIVPQPELCFGGNDLGYDVGKPRYKKGDLLYVRETWRISIRGDQLGSGYERLIQFRADQNRYAEHGPGVVIVKKRDWTFWDNLEQKKSSYLWRPSIHMPKRFARIWLRVTEDPRAERIQDITNEEISKEGLVSHLREHDACVDLQRQFIDLWDSLNAKRGFLYSSNPWAWRYAFERYER